MGATGMIDGSRSFDGHVVGATTVRVRKPDPHTRCTKRKKRRGQATVGRNGGLRLETREFTPFDAPVKIPSQFWLDWTPQDSGGQDPQGAEAYREIL